MFRKFKQMPVVAMLSLSVGVTCEDDCFGIIAENLHWNAAEELERSFQAGTSVSVRSLSVNSTQA